MNVKIKKIAVTSKGQLIPGQIIAVKPKTAKRLISAGLASKVKGG